MMKSDQVLDTKVAEVNMEIKSPVDSASTEQGVGHLIEIDPAKEAAARRKFDIYVLPVCFIFMILAVLDRNNVSPASIQMKGHTNLPSSGMHEYLVSTKTSASRVDSSATLSPFPAS